jgi:hypothetical protein
MAQEYRPGDIVPHLGLYGPKAWSRDHLNVNSAGPETPVSFSAAIVP